MTNWCDNNLIIRGNSAEIRQFKNSLLKDDNQYYPYVSTIPLLSLREEEIEAYVEREIGETLYSFGFSACNLELIEVGPEILELHLLTGYGEVKLNFMIFFPKLNFLLRFYEPVNNYYGFVQKHIAKVGEDFQ